MKLLDRFRKKKQLSEKSDVLQSPSQDAQIPRASGAGMNNIHDVKGDYHDHHHNIHSSGENRVTVPLEEFMSNPVIGDDGYV